MTQLMLDSGKKNIGYIGAVPDDIALGQERYRGFCDAIKEGNANASSDHYVIAELSMESGYEKAKELLEKNEKLDGIVCVTDRIAVGALQYLKEQNYAIPKDIALTGHGDSIMCKVADPMLTTIHYYYEDSGIKAAEILMQKFQDTESSNVSIKLGYKIIKKYSL